VLPRSPTFIQGVYGYIPETNHVYMVLIVVDILKLKFRVHIMLFSVLNVLYFYICTFRSMCATLSMDFVCSSFIIIIIIIY